MTVFAAPSVRTLGGKGVSGAMVNSNLGKIEKAKINVGTNTSANSGTITPARIGTLRAKNPKIGTVSEMAGNNSASRLPGIVPAKTYDSASYSGGYGGDKCCNVDVAAIIAAVMEKVEENYYDKDQVYNNENFVNAVLDLVNDDDPRIDAIKTSKPYHAKSLPDDYVYMWIEK